MNRKMGASLSHLTRPSLPPLHRPRIGQPDRRHGLSRVAAHEVRGVRDARVRYLGFCDALGSLDGVGRGFVVRTVNIKALANITAAHHDQSLARGLRLTYYVALGTCAGFALDLILRFEAIEDCESHF